jgi:hypothetical protein
MNPGPVDDSGHWSRWDVQDAEAHYSQVQKLLVCKRNSIESSYWQFQPTYDKFWQQEGAQNIWDKLRQIQE